MDSSLLKAQELLNQFACNGRPNIPLKDFPSLKAALKDVVVAASFLTLGVCADSASEGHRALNAYLEALGSSPERTQPANGSPEISGSIYIKYNTQTGKYYSSDYPGNSRGVLVCCHYEDPDLPIDMFGHLPLDLF